MLDALSAVEMDASLAIGGRLLLAAAIVNIMGSQIKWNSSRYSSKGDGIIEISGIMAAIAMIPLTVYAVTRAFPGFFQQIIVGFIVVGMVVGLKRVRELIAGVAAFPFAIVISVILFVLKALVFLYRIVFSSGDDDSDTDG